MSAKSFHNFFVLNFTGAYGVLASVSSFAAVYLLEFLRFANGANVYVEGVK